MSRNFELLSRVREAETLFPPVIADQSLDQRRARSDGKTVRNEVVEIDKAETPSHGPELSELAQEELIKLVQRMFVFPNSHGPRAVSFSSIEGDGSSQICFQIGKILAAQGSRSVCLVDANLQAQSLHRLLGVSTFPGLADAIVKPGPIKDYAVQIGRENLWLVPPGLPTPEIQRLFASDRLRSRITELKEQFDFLLIDAPAVTSHLDTVLLGQMTDGVILVLEANSTRRETARMVKEHLESAEVKILGAILNNRTFPIPEALYHKL